MRINSPPFGMVMPGRSYSTGTYRFGFNTQEKDDEICGAGNTNTAMFWEYSTRLGRRWNLDPKPMPSLSQYVCFSNNPIRFTDINGDSSVWDNKGYMIHYDPNDKDLRAYMQDGDKLTLMGSLGGDLDASIWFKNLLQENSKQADDLWDPGLIGDNFRTRVKENGMWDYKYRSPANPDDNIKQHLIGIAFYRGDRSKKGKGDLPETKFSFDGEKSARAEDLNNYHFGVVGKAFGLFTEDFMLKVAGSIEMIKWENDYKNKLRTSPEVPASWRPVIGYHRPPAETEPIIGAPYGDNPVDSKYIRQGFKYYDKNRSSLDGDMW